MLGDRVLTASYRQTITLDRLHFQKWRPGIVFILESDCAINASLDALHAKRVCKAVHNKLTSDSWIRRSEIMYPRGFNYNGPPYPVSPHDSHGPPPLSHPPYVYSPPSRYTCSTYPSASGYTVQNSSPSYSHIPQPLTHYGDPRFMEMAPRDEPPIPLHHLPQQAMDHHPQHSRQSMEGAAQLLPSCEQGNETIWCFYWCLLKITPFLSVITTLEAFNTLFGMHFKLALSVR